MQKNSLDSRARYGACLVQLMACIMYTDAITGTGDSRGGNKEEVARLVKTLELGPIAKSVRNNYLAKWNTWGKERKAQGKGPWLHTVDDPNEALTELLEFMTSRCFVHHNQQSTVRGYLAAINLFTRCSQDGSYLCRIA